MLLLCHEAASCDREGALLQPSADLGRSEKGMQSQEYHSNSPIARELKRCCDGFCVDGGRPESREAQSLTKAESE